MLRIDYVRLCRTVSRTHKCRGDEPSCECDPVQYCRIWEGREKPAHRKLRSDRVSFVAWCGQERTCPAFAEHQQN